MPLSSKSDVPKLDRALEAKEAYLKGFIDKSSFSVVLSWAGFSGLDIVEILEEVEPLVDKTATMPLHDRKFYINGDELCSIQEPSL